MNDSKTTNMNHNTEHPENHRSSTASVDPLISSLQNPHVKYAVKLRKRSHRDKAGLMIIEGLRELKRALDNQQWPVSLFYCEEFLLKNQVSGLIQQCREHGAEIYKCAPGVFRKIAYRKNPEGVLAVASQIKRTLDDLKITLHPLIIVAESIEKPGNLGTILRSADAAGVNAVLVCDHCTDIYNPNVVRASIGTLFCLPVIETSSQEAIEWLHKHHIQILAATPSAEQEYTEKDLRQGTAIIVGTEQHGLSDLWMNEADVKVRIPMQGQADSLNVASATTILLFEAVRQRKEAL